MHGYATILFLKRLVLRFMTHRSRPGRGTRRRSPTDRADQAGAGDVAEGTNLGSSASCAAIPTSSIAWWLRCTPAGCRPGTSRIGHRGLGDLGDLQGDVALGRPHSAGFVAVPVAPMALGTAAADVAIPAKEVRGFLLEQLLRQPLSPQAKQRPHYALVLRHASSEQTRDIPPPVPRTR